MEDNQIQLLFELASLYGIETTNYGTSTDRQHLHPSPEALLAVLQSLGAPVQKLSDVQEAIKEYKNKQYEKCCDPIHVTWNKKPVCIRLSLPSGHENSRACFFIKTEPGEELEQVLDLGLFPVSKSLTTNKKRYIIKNITLPISLPFGYHRLNIYLLGISRSTLIICAPFKAYNFQGKNRGWGTFLPLYALYSYRSWGAGDFTDLKSLLEWTRSLGGSIAGTVPFLSSFLDVPWEPSPYSPVSRLFWNEFYLDVTRIPELKECLPARRLLNSTVFQKELESVRKKTR